MKSEYFVLLPNDICCFFQTEFLSHRVKNEKVMTKTSSQLNAPVVMTQPPKQSFIVSQIYGCPPNHFLVDSFAWVRQ